MTKLTAGKNKMNCKQINKKDDKKNNIRQNSNENDINSSKQNNNKMKKLQQQNNKDDKTNNKHNSKTVIQIMFTIANINKATASMTVINIISNSK